MSEDSSFSDSSASDRTPPRGRHDKYAGLDASSASSDGSDKAIGPSGASKIIRNHREKSLTPRHADEAHSVASDVTEEIKHVRTEKTTSNITTASQTAVRSFRRLRANRQRVPGGAAAKLLGKAEDTAPAPEIFDDGDDALEVKPPSDELDRIRQDSLAEFSKGPKTNRRYHATESSDDSHVRRELESTPSEASLPSILNRTEIFHENATAAILSLLNPGTAESKEPKDTCSVVSSQSNDFTQVAIPSSSSNCFKPPQKDDDDSSVRAVKHFNMSQTELTASGKIQLQQPLLTKKAELKLEKIADQMVSPNKQIGDLMAAIASPKDGEFSRGYMVRRKNACGALQVLTANSVHRARICWTLGVLPSITSVLEDGGNGDLESLFPDRDTRREYIEARKRAIKALMNLSMAPDNRLAVFHSPRLVSAVIRVINQDDGESRRGCCAVLAHLAKTKENRLLLAQVPGLVDAATGVVEPVAPPREPKEEDNEDVDSVRSDEQPIESMGSSDASAGAPQVVESFMSDEDLAKKESTEVKVSKAQSEEDEDPVAASKRYDGDPNPHLHGARTNIFAFFSHLLKEKDNAYHLARHKYLMQTLVSVSKLHDSGAHEHAVKLLAHLTRHRGNSKEMVFKLRKVVPALVKATVSMNDEARKHACFAIQNLSQDKPCRQELAVTADLLTALCVRVRQAANPEERLSAVHALKNLTDEPANLIPMTNTPECFATLMQIAHASDDSVTEMMQYLGCDALATLSHWFRSIATSGQRIDTIKRGQKPSKELFVPTLKIVTWQRWQ